MKKIFAALIAFAAIGFILIGCANSSPNVGARAGQPALNIAPTGTPDYVSGYNFGRAALITGSPENLNLTPYIASGDSVLASCTEEAFVPVATMNVLGAGIIPANEVPPVGGSGVLQGQWENGCAAGYGE